MRGALCGASGGSGSGSTDEDADFLERALLEAAELVRRAQVRQDGSAVTQLGSTTVCGMGAASAHTRARARAHTHSHTHTHTQDLAEQQARAELTQGWLADTGSAPGGGADAPAPPEAAAAFLLEQGLNRAARLAGVLAGPEGRGGGSGSGGGALSLAQLQAKWMGLQRVLPGADLGDMVRGRRRGRGAC